MFITKCVFIAANKKRNYFCDKKDRTYDNLKSSLLVDFGYRLKTLIIIYSFQNN